MNEISRCITQDLSVKNFAVVPLNLLSGSAHLMTFFVDISSREWYWTLILKLPRNNRRSMVIWTLSLIIKKSLTLSLKTDWHITTAFFHISCSIFVARVNRFFTMMYLCVLATSHKQKDVFMLVYSVISKIKHQIRMQIKYEYQRFNLLWVTAKWNVTLRLLMFTKRPRTLKQTSSFQLQFC